MAKPDSDAVAYDALTQAYSTMRVTAFHDTHVTAVQTLPYSAL